MKNWQVDFEAFMQAFAAWDAAYREEVRAAERLYNMKLESPADETKLRQLVEELGTKRRKADELLLLLGEYLKDEYPDPPTFH